MRIAMSMNKKKFSRYSLLSNNEGAILPILAASLLVLIMFIGGVIDFGTAMIARSRISTAIDSSALAAAVAPKGQDRNAIAARYYAANYQTGFLGTDVTFQKLNVNIDDASGSVSINNNNSVMQTKLVQVGGVQAIPIASSVQVAFKQNNSKPQDQDIVLVLDESGSMVLNKDGGGGMNRWEALHKATDVLLDKFIPANPGDPNHNPNIRIGITSFQTVEKVKSPLSSDKSLSRNVINGINPATDGRTCGACGFKLAQEIFAGSPPPASQRSDGKTYSDVKSVIFLTDGRMNTTTTGIKDNKPAVAEILQKCGEIKSNNVKVYTIGFGNDLARQPDAYQVLNDCASLDANGKPLFYKATDYEQLVTVFDSIFASINQVRITQ